MPTSLQHLVLLRTKSSFLRPRPLPPRVLHLLLGFDIMLESCFIAQTFFQLCKSCCWMGIKADYKLEPCKWIKAKEAVLGLFRFLCFSSCLPVPCPSLGGDKQHVSIFSVCCRGRGGGILMGSWSLWILRIRFRIAGWDHSHLSSTDLSTNEQYCGVLLPHLCIQRGRWTWDKC